MAMKIESTRDGDIATVQAIGLIDTRAAKEFEGCIVGLCNDGVRALVVDFSKVELITSAGIRVLVMIDQRLRRGGGGLALCQLSERLRGVLEISGLLSEFRILATRAEAVAELTKITSEAVTPSASRLARLVNRLVVDELPTEPPAPRSEAPPEPCALTAHLREVLRLAPTNR